METRKITTSTLQTMKAKGEPITMLTAYDATFARLFDEAGIDILLVGDSLGMVVQGNKTTIPVTIDEMIYHTRCVAKGAARPLIMADMPFMSYQASIDQALINAGRLMKEGNAESVKIEGGIEMADTVAAMTSSGIPVCAHIGLRPQSVHQMGGYKIQGKTIHSADDLIEDAVAFEEAGTFALLLEGIVSEVASDIRRAVNIPTIGIGSGINCDGQVLVCYDMLGMDNSFAPKFLKKFASIGEEIKKASAEYIREVRAKQFPSEEHTFHRDLQVIKTEKNKLFNR